MTPDTILRRVCLRAARSVRDDGRLVRPDAAYRHALRREAVTMLGEIDANDRPAMRALMALAKACERAPSEIAARRQRITTRHSVLNLMDLAA